MNKTATKAEVPCYLAMLRQEGIASRWIFASLPEAIKQVEPYYGIIRLIELKTDKVVWQRA